MNIPNIAGESQEGNIDRKAYNPSHIAPPLDVTFSFSSLIAVLDSDVTRPSSSSHHKIIKFKTQKNYTYERTKDLRFIRFAALLRHGNNHTMFTLKNKVTEKLSHLFADAPTSPSSTSLPSPLDDNNHRPEVISWSKFLSFSFLFICFVGLNDWALWVLLAMSVWSFLFKNFEIWVS